MNPKQGYVLLRHWLKDKMQAKRNRRAVAQYTNPGSTFFEEQICWLLDRDKDWLIETAAEYRACPKAWQHLSGLRSSSRKTDGIAKSLDVAEGFALWTLVKHVRPKAVVELGVQYGVSARLWKEALKAYVAEHELILCDLEDKRRLINDEECTFLRADARQILPEVFSSRQVGILHNDAHPYDLIYWSVEEALKHDVPVLTFHDVGKGARSSFKLESSRLSREQKLANAEYSAGYGHWERHVMAEIFDPEILHKDRVERDGYRIQIFDSLFGFGVVLCD